MILGSLPFVPRGTTLPPLPYLLVVLLAAIGVAVAIRRRRPAIAGSHVLGIVPWIALGATLHVLYVLGALPGPLAPFGGSPTVYVAVATLAGAVWVGADAAASGVGTDGSVPGVPAALAAVGTVLLVPAVAVALVAGGLSGPGARWSAVAVVLGVPLAAAVWAGLTRVSPGTTVTGGVGALVVLGHTLDGVSTAVGVARLGFGERSPLSRILLELGWLPSVPVLGEGWLFLLVKLVVACVVVHLFAPYVRDVPSEGLPFLGFVAAVGLGPALHNLLLFTITA